jgi:hypothetical protein
MSPRDDDDREKLSWREVDKLRDHSRHVDGERKSFAERTLRSDWARKQHMREAEKFFQGVKGSAAYKESLAALHQHYGTPDFAKSLNHFIQQFGLPDDWGTLLLVLDSNNPEWIKGALLSLKGMYEKRSPIEQRGFKGKVKVLAMTAKDKNLRQECDQILQEL